jgi:hypothetical protein
MENVEYFSSLDNIITNDARGTCEIKYRIVMEKTAFNRKKAFYQQIGLKFKEQLSKVLHFLHRFVWC